MSDAHALPSPHDYYRHTNQHRFTVELEFLSSLASPAYLTHLHALGHLHDASFVRYLGYIHKTWSQPRYVRFLRFPNALVFCRALAQSPTFRSVVGQEGWEHVVTSDIVAGWASRDRSDGDDADSDDDDEVVTRGNVVAASSVKMEVGSGKVDANADLTTDPMRNGEQVMAAPDARADVQVKNEDTSSGS